MLHVAAQGDQPASLAYFLLLGIDINSRDSRLSTPLHWAAFAGADLALTFILAQGAEVNLQDLKGLTPVHLAVRTSEEIQTTRSIRALLLKGANPLLKNDLGQLPQDYLLDFKLEVPGMQEMTDEIRNLLNPDQSMLTKDCECFALKVQYRKR